VIRSIQHAGWLGVADCLTESRRTGRAFACSVLPVCILYTPPMSEPESKYVLTTDPRMPSKSNLWGTMVGRSHEDASARFKAKIQQFYSPSKMAHFARMKEDRARRLRENDFSVELS
jgi:hypothetical protein